MAVAAHCTPRLTTVLQSFQVAATKSLSGPNGALFAPGALWPSKSKAKHLLVAPSPRRLPSPATNNLNNNAMDDSCCASPKARPELAASPFKAAAPVRRELVQKAPIIVPPDEGRYELSETILYGEKIACFEIGGERRLCLPQILNTTLREYGLAEINTVCVELQINCSRCSSGQLDALKAHAILPASAPSCGLITKTDAEHLVSALVDANPPRQPSSKNGTSSDGKAVEGSSSKAGAVKVYHECFGKAVGLYRAASYSTPLAPCIECLDCHGLFNPMKFVCHTHRAKVTRTIHWGFDSEKWRHYLLLAKDHGESETAAKDMEEMKARFDPMAIQMKLAAIKRKDIDKEPVSTCRRELRTYLNI